MLSGCGGGGDDGERAGTAATTAEVGEPRPTTSGSPEIKGTKTVQLNLEQRHPNGTVLKVIAVSYTERSVSLTIEAFNGGQNDVRLSGYWTARLEDDVRNKCHYAPPVDNEDLGEGPASTSEVEVAKGPAPSSRVATTRVPITAFVRAEPIEVRSQVEARVAQVLSDLQAASKPEGTVVVLPERVLFEFDRADLKPAGRDALDKLAEAIVFYAPAPVTIRGFTDATGSDSYNQSLSERRANAVRTYLAGKPGVDGARLRAEGRGERDPIAPNDNDAGRAQNRRVEIVIEGVQR